VQCELKRVDKIEAHFRGCDCIWTAFCWRCSL